VYRLPEHMRDAVEAQYRRDVARVHGGEAGRFDDEYKDFIKVCLWGGVGAGEMRANQGAKQSTKQGPVTQRVMLSL
jgi:hypothetical protein